MQSKEQLLKIATDAARYQYLREFRMAKDFASLPEGWIHVAQAGTTVGCVLYGEALDKVVDDARGLEILRKLSK